VNRHKGPGSRIRNHRKRGRVVDCTGLENRRSARTREFESHRFRHFTYEAISNSRPTPHRTRLNVCARLRQGSSSVDLSTDQPDAAKTMPWISRGSLELSDRLGGCRLPAGRSDHSARPKVDRCESKDRTFEERG
jgi:hypothetical protein